MDALAHAFAQHGRIHIPRVLTTESAERVCRALIDETPYNLTVNDGGKVYDLKPDDVAKMSPQARKALEDAAGAGALKGFQIFYGTHRLSDAGEPYPDPTRYHARIVAFLESPDFLGFVRKITGEASIAFADAQATRYSPGHFLTQHNDAIPGKNRLAGFVLNMTPFWQPDWGGNLLFLGRDGHIAEGYVPCFNALNILRVPQVHMVSQVTSFAAGHRYSITGWFRSG